MRHVVYIASCSHPAIECNNSVYNAPVYSCILIFAFGRRLIDEEAAKIGSFLIILTFKNSTRGSEPIWTHSRAEELGFQTQDWFVVRYSVCSSLVIWFVCRSVGLPSSKEWRVCLLSLIWKTRSCTQHKSLLEGRRNNWLRTDRQRTIRPTDHPTDRMGDVRDEGRETERGYTFEVNSRLREKIIT